MRFVGQEVALVVAQTALAAQDAAEKIEVEYRDLPAVVDAAEALAPGAEQLYPEIPGNLCFDYEYGDEAGTEAAFARAAHVTRVTLDSRRMVGNPMERGLPSRSRRGADRYDLYGGKASRSCGKGERHHGNSAEKIMVRPGTWAVGSDPPDAYAEYCVAMQRRSRLAGP